MACAKCRANIHKFWSGSWERLTIRELWIKKRKRREQRGNEEEREVCMNDIGKSQTYLSLSQS